MTTANAGNIRALVNRGRRSAILVGVLGTGIRAGANLLLLPILLVKLAPADLAMWWAFLALGGFAFLADFGFGPAISRVYSYLWAGADDFETEGLPVSVENREPNFERLRELNSTVRYLYRRLSLIGISALAVGGSLFLRHSIEQTDHPAQLWVAWGAYALVIGYNLMTSHWLQACQGVNRIRELQMGFVFSSLSYVTVASCLLLAGGGLAAVVAAALVRACVSHLYCRAVYLRAVAGHRGKTQVNLHMVKRLWPNACKFGVLSIGAYCISNAPVLVSTRVLTPEITASIGLTTQLGTFAVTFAALWLSVKWPQITILRTQGRLVDMACLFARRLGLVMASYFAIAAVLLLWGNVLLAWKGTHTKLLPAPYLAFYFAYLAQNIFYVQFGTLAYTENVVPFFKISIYTGVAELVVSYILARVFGLWGLLSGLCLTELAYSSWYTVRRGFQGQPLSVRAFCRALIFGQPGVR
jgi:O-antigen/teichoic acid export membrane protein